MIIWGRRAEPPRLTDVDAFDHPSDDGTTIDVVWTRSDVPDFAFYTIWVSEHPLDDVTSLWFFCSDDLPSCVPFGYRAASDRRVFKN